MRKATERSPSLPKIQEEHAAHFTFPSFKSNRFHAHSCNRCGHKWMSSHEEKPRVCPKCKSVYWDSPRKLYYDWHAKHRKLVEV